MPISFRLSMAVAAVCVSCLQAGSAGAFRIIASSSGGAGIAQAPCCDTSFDGGYEVSTTPVLPGLEVNVLNAGGAHAFTVPHVSAPGEFTEVSMSGAARASMLDIGARATVDLTNWSPDFTGETIEVFSSALLEQTFTPDTSEMLYLRPVFQIDGSVSHAAGLVSSLTFNMRATLPGSPSPSDNILLEIDGGTPGSTGVVDAQLTGPDLVVAPGASLFLSLRLSAQVSGSVNGIAGGDQFGEVDAFNTLTLLGFETYSDAGYSQPLFVQFTSDSGQVFATVPEPASALLVGFGLATLAGARRRR